jgi:small-conductance mechanosensitive channel
MSIDWSLVLEYLSISYLQALLVIVASILAAWIVRLIVVGTLVWLTRHTRTSIDDRLMAVLRRPVFVSVILVGLHVATGLLGLPDTPSLVTKRILMTLAILIWMSAGFKIVHILLEGMSRVADRVTWIEARTLPLFENLAKVVVFGLALYALLRIWRWDVGPWLASAGIVGIAVGFAAKDSLANLFGGLFILADAPYKVGDWIILDAGERGRVTKIGLRSSRLLTRDDIEITLPNAQIANAKIVNESGGPWEKERVTVNVGVAYGSDVDQVRRVLLEAARSVDHVVADPEPRVRFTSFGDSALIFRLLCWIDEPVLRGRCIDALNTEVYQRFQAEGVEIPFPQRVVHLQQ